MESNENNYASTGLAGTGLGLGAGALGLMLLNGNLGNIFGGQRPAPEPPATQRDLAYERDLTEKDAKIGQLQAQLYTDQKVNELRQEVTAGQAAQAVINANQQGMLGILQQQVAMFQAMTGQFIKPNGE